MRRSGGRDRAARDRAMKLRASVQCFLSGATPFQYRHPDGAKRPKDPSSCVARKAHPTESEENPGGTMPASRIGFTGNGAAIVGPRPLNCSAIAC